MPFMKENTRGCENIIILLLNNLVWVCREHCCRTAYCASQ